MKDLNSFEFIDVFAEAALKNGHVSCASLLVGDLGTWQGLLTLEAVGLEA